MVLRIMDKNSFIYRKNNEIKWVRIAYLSRFILKMVKVSNDNTPKRIKYSACYLF